MRLLVLMLIVWVLPVCAQQSMGSTTKAVPRYPKKSAASVAPPAIDFRDVSGALGISATNLYGGDVTRRHILEMTGNGVALFDYDNDNLVDVLLVNGTRLDGTTRSSVLYRNTGKDKFVDATSQSRLNTSGWKQGVCAGDFDNDSYTDVLITGYGDNLLLQNDHGRFKSVPFPQTPDAFNTGCSFLDYDRDGRLDLFVANYVSFPRAQLSQLPSTGLCNWLGLSVFCGPRGFASGVNHLYHNEGNGIFRELSGTAGIQVSGLHYGLGVTSADFDGDGWPDIYVACDSTPSLLYRNNHNGSFSEIAVGAGVAYGDNGEEQGGMGTAAADYDNDGVIDLIRSNFIDETSTTLYRNLGDLFFSNETVGAGHAVNTRYVAWGVQFIDVDSDGFKDVVVAAGHIYPELAKSRTTDPFEMARLLYWNTGSGVFRDVSQSAGVGISEKYSSRGLATADLDGDGNPEIVIVNMNRPVTVLKNFAPAGNSITVKLTGVESNTSAIGAIVRVICGSSTQTSTVTSGSGYLSQSDFRQHFGLGKRKVADRIEVVWPRGRRESYQTIVAGQEIRIMEGKGIVERVSYGR